MRLFSTLLTGREALITHGTALASVSDNLANQNTPGFKEQRVEFADMLSQGQGGLYSEPKRLSNGVTAKGDVVLHNEQGSLNFTNRELDFAVQGKGFFVVTDGESEFYTRAGNFQQDATGNIVTASGQTLMGFTPESPDALVALNTSGVAATPTATANQVITGNLNTDVSTAPLVQAPVGIDNFSALNSQSQFSTSTRAIDSLGLEHDITYHFFHTGNLEYTVQAYVDAGEVGGVVGTPSLLGSGTIAFQPDGTQGEGAVNALTINPAWSNGATAGAITADLSQFTGFSTTSSVRSITNDGVVPGEVTGLTLASDGTLQAVLDNGGFVAVGTVALADFVNLNGLDKRGSNLYQISGSEGERTVGAPTSGTFGETKSGALENSTVDIASQFVDVIRYQRGYQAGSTIIGKIDELLNTTLGLV